MEILLIRHGEARAHAPENFSELKNQSDPALTALGCEQAERLGARLEGFGLRAVYSSDLVRATQTAEIIARHAGVPVLVREGIREIDMGRLNHISWEELAAEDPAFCEAWNRHETDMRYPGGETGAEAAARSMKVLAEVARSDFKKAAIVTHGGIIRAVFCAILGLAQEKRFLFGPPENTSVSVVSYSEKEDKFVIERTNDAMHLV